MNKRNLPYFIVATALVGSIIQAAWFWPQLPDEVASHFNGAGQADGWMSKSGFVSLAMLIQFGTAAFLLGIGRITRMLPNSIINIPNKGYWLAEERRAATLRDTAYMLAWIAAATGIFFLFIFQMSFDANINENNGINMIVFLVATAAYVAFVIGSCIHHTMKYNRIPKSDDSLIT